MNDFESLNPPRSRSIDIALLIGSAFLICVLLTGSFLLADKYQVDAIWVFVAINSLGIIPIVGKRYRRGMPNRLFIPFVGAWMLVHGALATFLIVKIHVVYWLPAFAIELGLGFWISIQLSQSSQHPGQM